MASEAWHGEGVRYREYAEPLCGPTVTRLTRSVERGVVKLLESQCSCREEEGKQVNYITGAETRVTYVCTARGT